MSVAGSLPPAGALTPPSFSTDWQDAVLRGGAIQDHNLSISSGTTWRFSRPVLW